MGLGAPFSRSFLRFDQTARTIAFPRFGHQHAVVRVAKGAIAMKDSTKDKVEGAAHELKGAVKEKIGRATNKPKLEDEGTDEKIGGKVQKKVGDIEKVIEK
jgi:uncharacterized protein YjbJ (UPF0337 family)